MLKNYLEIEKKCYKCKICKILTNFTNIILMKKRTLEGLLESFKGKNPHLTKPQNF